jgi:Asp-tRNA(Asn)/Glu-tRNA(Gln) amidotransferase A subunit family amidase
MDPAFLTIAELSRLNDQRELSPVEVTRALLDRIAAHDSKLHSWTPVPREQAAAASELMDGGIQGRRRNRDHRSFKAAGTMSLPPMLIS